ncbi:MAG: hydroxyacid dehydrogenase [Alphaproteobacteria bacterium]|jgi:D-3-phosphoglycerate dehydrogenase|nr:hydroxyacid dehydrogenase [Alphaproteobacteria bacterium]
MSSASTPWIALAANEQLPILEDPVLKAAGDAFEVRGVALPYKPLSAEEEAHWAGALEGAGAILLRSGYITASLLDRLPDLKVIAVHGAGVDPVDVAACTERGVLVTNTPGANADAVTEITFGLMLALLRRIPEAAHKAKAEKAWDSARHTGGELKGRVLGLIGLGQIGQRVARIADAFGMGVIAHDPALSEEEITRRGAEPMSFDGVLASADILSLHAPAIPATRHMINADAIAKMKPSAMIVNCARGSLIDEAALSQALVEGRLGGAALDVLEGEPPDPNSPIYGAPNLIVTPHMAGSTEECLRTIAGTAGADMVRVLSGQPPLHPVNEI